MLDADTWLIVGKLVAPQGLTGELRVNPSSDFPERFIKPGKRWVQKEEAKQHPREIQLLAGRKLPGKSIYVVRFAGLNNRTEAEALIGQNLLVEAKNRPKMAKDEFHFLDLLRLEARLTKEGPPIGKVVDLISGGNDLLKVKLFKGKTVLIPFVQSIVPEVNLEEGWLRITPPPGLLEL